MFNLSLYDYNENFLGFMSALTIPRKGEGLKYQGKQYRVYDVNHEATEKLVSGTPLMNYTSLILIEQ